MSGHHHHRPPEHDPLGPCTECGSDPLAHLSGHRHRGLEALGDALGVLLWADGPLGYADSLRAVQAATAADHASYESTSARLLRDHLSGSVVWSPERGWHDAPEGPPDGPAPHPVRPAIRDRKGSQR